MYNETSYNLRANETTVWNTNNYVEANANNLATYVAVAIPHQQSGQHKDVWSINFNQHLDSNYSNEMWKRIAQHELGHIFGLKDLDTNQNSLNLMYGYVGNYTGLKAKDLKGLKLIWGF